MHNISRRSLIAYGLVSAQGILAACGGSDGGSEAAAATASTGTSPAPGETAGPTTAPAPAPTSAPAPQAPAPPAPAPAPAVWDVGPALRLVADAATSFDLSITLPASVRRGGVFRLAADSAALPAGVTLDPVGILRASSAAGVASVAGLVFSYDEP